MSWRNLNSWSRWLVLQASAPPIYDGVITLSTIGIRLDLRALCQAAVPELLPASGAVESFDQLWQCIENEEQREKFILFLEWLVLADTKCAQNLISLTSLVLTPGEAWRASAPIVFDETARDIAAPLARRWLTHPLQSSERSTISEELTQSQMQAYRRISAMARAYFSRPDLPYKIEPRLMPLCIGPTGTGKTSLLRRIAKENKATFLRTSAGEWTPVGVRSVRPTLACILEALATSVSGSAVVLVDELDKVSGNTDTNWARSVLNEIYATSDRSIPIASLLHGDNSLKLSVSAEELRDRVERKLFLVAAGTWQALWSTSTTMGFGGAVNTTARVVDTIATQKIVPIELLMRFTWPPVTLAYPDQAETMALFEKTGLTRLAANLGVTLDPTQHDWSRGGFRSIESIAGELLTKAHELEPHP